MYSFPAIEDEDTIGRRANVWNMQLNTRVSEFARETPKATVYTFSTHAALTEILDNPEYYDFVENDTMEENGAIWADQLHATAAVHKILTDRLLTRVGVIQHS